MINVWPVMNADASLARNTAGPGDLLDRRPALHRNPGDQALLDAGVRPREVGEVGSHPAGHQRVDPDPCVRPLDRGRPRQREDGGLRRAVVRHQRDGAEAGDRRDVDHRARAAPRDVLPDRLHHVQRRVDVERLRLLPPGVAQAHHRAHERVPAGVVDDDVQPAEVLDRRSDRGLHGIAIRDVRRKDERPSTVGGHDRRDLCQQGGVARQQRDVRARRRVGLGDRTADAAGRTRDQRRLAGQVEGAARIEAHVIPPVRSFQVW